ncbi:MAG: cadherin-like domain-containing protein [Trueperaceae bacterium]|nr:cadherin-like domain-containing protein [Trueperaceae bacterium]
MVRLTKYLGLFVVVLGLLVACTQDPPVIPDPNTNNPPSAQAQSLTVVAGKTLEITLKATDPDGDSLTYSVDNLSTTGVNILKLNGFTNSHKVSYTAPATAKEGETDSFSFSVKDPSGEEASATIKITLKAAGSSPGISANDDSFSGLINTPLALGATTSGPAVKLTGSVLENDANVSTATKVTAEDKVTAQGGNVSLSAEGGFVYTPKAGFAGQDSFTYTLVDNSQSLDRAEATVIVTVEEANPEVDGTQTILYLKADAASNGDGSALKPYRSLIEAENRSKVGDIIVLQPGRYAPAGTHSIILKNDQKILGQEADVVIRGMKVLDKNTTEGTVLARSEDNNFSLVLLDTNDKKNIKVLRQSDNVTIKGLTIDRSNGAGKTADTSVTTGGAGIVGADVLNGTITIEDVKIMYPGGFGITFAESSGCPSLNCDNNVQDPTDSITPNTTYDLVIRNVYIESPRNSGISSNDATSVIIDNVTINNAVKLDKAKLDPDDTLGHGIEVQSEYDTTVMVTNSTVNSSDPGVKAFVFFSNNTFGRNPDDAVMNVTIANNHANFSLNGANDLNNDGNVDDTVAYDIHVLDDYKVPEIGSSMVIMSGSSRFTHADSPYAFEGLSGSATVTGDTVTF